MLSRHRTTCLGLEPLEDRTVLNNRFVVPFEVPADDTATFHTLGRALTKAGLTSGDVIQIEPNSVPGTIFDSNLPVVTNLTIRGHPSFAARDLPEVNTGDAISVDAAQQGLKLENLNLVLGGTTTGGLTFNANGSLLSSLVNYVGPNANDAITLNATATTLRNNTLLRSTLGIGGGELIQVNTVAGGQNVIVANTLQVMSPAVLLRYSGNNTISDRVEDNLFVGNELGAGGENFTGMLFVEALNGLTVQRNVFRDGTDINSTPFTLELGVQNITVRENLFDFPAAEVGDSALTVGLNVPAGLTTSVTVTHNVFRGPARGVNITAASSGTLNVKVEGNDFAGSSIGVRIASIGGSLANVDLGGGTQGSLGGNNFRAFKTAATSGSGAIVINTGTSALGTIQAQNNLFGTADPETAVFDNGDESTRANVTTTGALTGNAAFVQALFVKFLKRVGNLANANDAGGWVTQLTNGTPASAVANGIVRSAEALGFVVDGLYRGILGRDADAGGRATHVNLLANGATVEQIQAAFFASAEYRLRFAGDPAYIASLYQTLLGRSPTPSEIDGWLSQLPTLGRQGVAAGFLGSTEHRNREVTKLYFDLLKRTTPPTAGEVSANVNTGFDLLTLRVGFAGSAEFFANG